MPVLTLALGFVPQLSMSLAPILLLPSELGIASESPSMSQMVSQAEMEEPSVAVDIVKQFFEESSFEERIEMVRDILETELWTVMNRSSNFTMSVSKLSDGPTYKRLPASAKFAMRFDDYVNEVAARQGSHGAVNIRHKFPMEVDKLPNRP